MKKFLKLKLNIFHLALFLLAVSFILLPFIVKAETTADNLSFPVVELGNCQDQAACKIYCDAPNNMPVCVDFSLRQGFINSDEAAIAKKAVLKIKTGQTPGGCKSREECSNYCQNNASDMKTCIAFAEEIGIPAAEIAQAKQVASALEKGASLPGNCQGKAACENYCSDVGHIDECLVFAEAAQILPAEEIAEAKKMVKFMKNGEMPGGCKSKNECQNYCGADSNFEECINFAEKAELISKEEIEIAKKTGGKGPGGCKSKAGCETYCNNQQNAKVCADFAVEKGLVSQEEVDNIKNGAAKIKDGLEKIPAEIKPEVEACLNNLLGGGLVNVLSGQQAMTKAQGESIGPCFENAANRYANQQREKMQSQAGQGNEPPSQEQLQEMMQGAPEEIKSQIQEQVKQQSEERKQKEIQKNMPTNLPEGVSSMIPSIPENISGAPANIPAPPVDIPSGPPAGVDMPLGVPPSGIQGPPCGSPEECQAMFGGGPPAGMPQ